MPQNNTVVLPVEEQKLKGQIKHIVVELPALDAQWAVPRRFSFYVFPPKKLPDGNYVPGSKETWLECMSHLLDDIWWLCELQYHKFWSQVLFDKTCMDGIRSFLHLAPLQKLYFRIEDRELLSMYKRIKNAVFQFMKRLLRTKESDLNFMSYEKYKKIMSEHDLIPVSLLFCLCVVYGTEKETVQSMVAHSFENNVNMKLDKAVLRSVQLFSRLKKKLRMAYHDLRRNLRCSNDTSYVLEATNAYRQCLLSTVQFLANAALNISNFLSIYKEGCEVFLDNDFDFHVIRVFKKLLIPAYQEINVLFSHGRYKKTYNRIISMLDLTRFEFIKAFNLCLQISLEKLSNTNLSHEIVQRYVQLMKFALKNESFLFDLNATTNLAEISETVKKKCPGNVDLTEVDRVSEAVNELLNEKNSCNTDSISEVCINNISDCITDNEIYDYVKENYDSDGNDSDNEPDSDHELKSEKDDVMSSHDDSSDYSDWSKNENSDSEYEGYLEDDSETLQNGPAQPFESELPQLSNSDECASKSHNSKTTFSEVQLQTAISQTKDLLPHLGDGFIAMCLRHYNMDATAVINAVLENNLPEYLKAVDFTLSSIPAFIFEEIEPELDNTPDGYPNKIPEPGLKEFKKTEYHTYKEMFNDKREVNELKSIYEKYRNIEEDEIYDDDVDEDYEEQPVAALEVDPEGFYNKYTRLPICNPNRVYEVDEESEPEPEEDTRQKSASSSQNNSRHKPLDFCENPEVTRARAEQRRQNILEKRYGRRSTFHNSNFGKSQTEKSETSQSDGKSDDRHRKNVHKATAANHSRRFLSDRKRRV